MSDDEPKMARRVRRDDDEYEPLRKKGSNNALYVTLGTVLSAITGTFECPLYRRIVPMQSKVFVGPCRTVNGKLPDLSFKKRHSASFFT